MARNLNSTTSNKYIMFASYVKLSLYSVSFSLSLSLYLSLLPAIFLAFRIFASIRFSRVVGLQFSTNIPFEQYSLSFTATLLCFGFNFISFIQHIYAPYNTHKFHTLTKKRLFRCDEMSAPFHCALIASFIRLTNKTHRSSGI